MVNEGIINLGNAKLISLDPNISISCSNDIKFLTSDTEKMRIDSSGNVGIGTNNPIVPMHIRVSGTTNDVDASDSAGRFDDYHLIMNKIAGTSTGSEIGLGFDIQSGAEATNTRSPGASITHERTGDYSKGKIHFKTKTTTGSLDYLTTAMTINDDSNVGIGTTSPSTPLHIYSGTGGDTITINNTNTGTTGRSSIRFIPNGNIWELGARNSNSGDLTNKFYLYDINSSAARLVVESSTGNIGIGTTSPTEKLHINYTNNELKVSDGNIIYGREENISRQSSLSTAETYYGSREHSIIRNANLNYRNTGDSGARYDTHKIVLGYSDTYDFGDNGYYPTYNAIKFQTVPGWDESATGGTTLNTNMIILSNGNVGIGTTSPSSGLHIKTQDEQFRIQTTRSSNSYLNFASSGVSGADWDLRYSSNGSGNGDRLWFWYGGDQRFYTNGGTDRMIIKSNGNVGINNTNPTEKLEVNGNIKGTNFIGTLDNYESSQFFRREGRTNASVGSGWISVATCTSNRYAGEILVTDQDSSDHGYIRIHWMRSYKDSNFTVLNCGGHNNRITGARVLYETSNDTYGVKILQVNVTVTSNYSVSIFRMGDDPNYGTFTAVTPVVENSKTGYAVHGNELTDLNTYGFAHEEGILAGGNMKVNGNVGINNTNPQNRLDIIQDNARSGTHRTDAAIYATSNSSADYNGTIEVRHYNGTQGIGIGYNSLYATGSNTDQNINLIPRGSGCVGINKTNPSTSYKLDVNGDTNIVGNLKINNSNISLNNLDDVTVSGTPAHNDVFSYQSSQWININPLYTGQSFGVKLGQYDGSGYGSWGYSSFNHMTLLRADFSHSSSNFSQYRNQIKFPNGVTQHMDDNASTITLPYDGYYFYCGSFTQRSGSTSAEHHIRALLSGVYTQVSPSHFRNDSSTTGGSLTYAWCMYFPAGSVIRVYQQGYIHRSSIAGTSHNQFTIHYVGANYGTHVYGTV